MFNLNPFDYVPLAAILFMIVGVILVNFKKRKISKFFVAFYAMLTITTASVVMTECSVIAGILMMLGVIFPIALSESKKKEQSKKSNCGV